MNRFKRKSPLVALLAPLASDSNRERAAPDLGEKWKKRRLASARGGGGSCRKTPPAGDIDDPAFLKTGRIVRVECKRDTVGQGSSVVHREALRAMWRWPAFRDVQPAVETTAAVPANQLS